MKNVLYTGMEDDIILPFLVEPDFDNLYVINDNDIASGTWEEQIDDIVSILENGSDEFLSKPEEHPMTGRPLYKIRGPIARLPDGPCKIISSNTEEAKKFELYKYKEATHIVKANGRYVTFSWYLTKDKTKSWKVVFEYGGKVRTMTYYLRDFYEVWPREVKNIDALIWCGAFSWSYFTDERINEKYNIKGFRENIEKRCNLPLSIYGNPNTFPYVSVVNTSKYRKERLVSKLILRNFNDGWWKKDYSLMK
jgi:hypothetical protein